MKIKIFFVVLIAVLFSCKTDQSIKKKAPFDWKGANIYFLLTDRFNNGNPDNDLTFNRTEKTATLRNFEGGDIAGITEKINSGYFNDLGINAIWLSPVVEQIHGATDEGTGVTYGYHGYWAKDWSALDPNFGTEEDFKTFVEAAHEHGIRVVLDVVVNHTGPVTDLDPVWPDEWVRTGPRCVYQDYESTVTCTLVENLPDIKTESNDDVELPKQLLDKWEKEGRKEKEIKELDEFFTQTGFPRAPRFYIMKWILDFVKQFGIDGLRLDTTKHTEDYVWSELSELVKKAFEDWKKLNPESVLDTNSFFLVGETYGYSISSGRMYDYGDKKVDFFAKGLDSQINFEFKGRANDSYESIFSQYSDILHNELKGYTVLNYISSHDDGAPFDRMRQRPFEAANKLLLCPGESQVYYGDESARLLAVEGVGHDADLRSFMNWDEIKNNVQRDNYTIQQVLEHWQKLGRFRAAHPAVGAGVHRKISDKPYAFTRTYNTPGYSETVLISIDNNEKTKIFNVEGVFADGTVLTDCYSGITSTVSGGSVSFDCDNTVLLISE